MNQQEQNNKIKILIGICADIFFLAHITQY